MSIQPLSIEIGGNGGPAYKSINHLIWRDIPGLSVLTGLNGSGKSQLLEFLNLRLTKANRNRHAPENRTHLHLEGDMPMPSQVVYVPCDWQMRKIGQSTVHNLSAAKRQLLETLKQKPGNIQQIRQKSRITQVIGSELANQLSRSTVSPAVVDKALEKLDGDISYLIDESSVETALSGIFHSYRISVLDELGKGLSKQDAEKKLGSPPWLVLNEIIQTAGFDFSVTTPEGQSLLSDFTARFSVKNGALLDANELSSGEQSIIQTCFWLYCSQIGQGFPTLMLLDEPDAHLHPSMARQFLSVVNDVLVRKYGVRVIITTHSPSTVALAPEGSVFEIQKGVPEVRQPAGIQQAIGRLTAGLVTVGAGTRYCFVEDSDDVSFYSIYTSLLSEFGQHADAHSLSPSPSIVFLPASVGKGPSKQSGGRNAVISRVAQFEDSGLSSAFCGIIDLDDGNTATENVTVLDRYSIENYLADPLLIYAAAIDAGKPISVQGVSIGLGQEHLLSKLPPRDLQNIVDTLSNAAEQHFEPTSNEDRSKVETKFTNGLTLSYPKWQSTKRGKDVLAAYRNAYDGGTVNLGRLLRAAQRCRIIPIAIAKLLQEIQRNSSDS